jgi:hypothetical protein
MRKFLIAALAAAMVLALGGIAYAVNEYTVDGNSRPVVKGSKKKPVPVSLSFDYTVRDLIDANRGTPVQEYRIGAEGLVTYPEAFPACRGDDKGVNKQVFNGAEQACPRKTKVGEGIIYAYVGASIDQTQREPCVLKLTLWNVKPGDWGVYGKIRRKEGGLAIRIDSIANTPPALKEQYKGRCLNNQNRAILAPYRRVKIGGVASDELVFTVPDVLLYPARDENGNPVIESVVRDVFSKIKRRTARKKIGRKRRKVGFYSAIGCKGNTRLIQVTFVDDKGDAIPESNNTRKC